MDSLYLLIPIALIFCVIAVGLLIWAVNNGQYDDLDKEAWRILSEERDQRDEKRRSVDSGKSGHDGG